MNELDFELSDLDLKLFVSHRIYLSRNEVEVLLRGIYVQLLDSKISKRDRTYLKCLERRLLKLY